MKNKTNTLVIGSGAGGLGASVWLKKLGVDFMVVEALAELPMNMHNGVHYLHSIPPLPFNANIKKITLTDGILYEDRIYHEPNLEFSLKYSEKVREIQHPSSIMDIGKDENVYMPESNSLNAMLESMYEYSGKENFFFGFWLKTIDTEKKIASFDKDGAKYDVEYENIISTLPLDKFKKIVNLNCAESLELKCNPVHITNYKLERIVPNWMINLYVPNGDTPIYRASMLNNICSVESIRPLKIHETHQVRDILKMFHLSEEEPEVYTWNTGKVMSISIDDRAKLVDELQELSIYCVGRFGLWNRKLLIDSTIEQSMKAVQFINKEIEWQELRDKLTK